ncbi:hypothetical protein ACF3NS_00500 [Arsenicicoccus cauae]|uniref:hypothetical protein n=1 Tax=Arsenicicoccus cauae TaxID=2663847 RepID=UPI00370D724F
MQTVLGANGQIAVGLTRELYRSRTHDIRLVSRSPHKVHDTDQPVAADLTDAEATSRVSKPLKEMSEQLPRYRGDDVFDSSAFTRRFPDLAVTTYRDGIAQVLGGAP